MAIGITDAPLKLLYTYPAVVVGMIYVLLPFMFESVYQVAEKLELSLVEASRDLGAGKVRTFFSVTLPLTLPGLKTGVILTFIPSMGLFFIAQILGGNKIVLVGSLIEELLMKAHNQPMAAALSVILMLLTGIVCVLLLRKAKWQISK
jgi:spermidine/putrescine transport system permease protein